MDAREKSGESIDLSFSLGLIASKEGDVREVILGSPAYAAGLGPGMKLIAVNGRKWSKDVVRAALRASVHNQHPMTLLAENGECYNIYEVNYHEGDAIRTWFVKKASQIFWTKSSSRKLRCSKLRSRCARL